MQIVHTLNVDLCNQESQPRIRVMQADANTRILEMHLYSGDEVWPVPEGVSAALHYCKPDGTVGLYDKLPDGAAALSVSENLVAAVLAPQMLTVPGLVRAVIVLKDANGKQLSTFPFQIQVEKNPAAGVSVSDHYINVASAIGNLEDLTTEDKSNLVAAINEIAGSGGNAENGEDGFSPVATVRQTDTGAVISITDVNGTTTATVTNGKDGAAGPKGDRGDPGEQGIRGEKGDKGDKGDTGAQGIQGVQGDTGAAGADGYTPVKGVDYWTDTDKAEMDARIVEEVAKYMDTGEAEEASVSNDWSGWTVHPKTNINSSCKLAAHDDYTTYSCVVSDDTNLWFSDYPEYTCIAIYPSGIADTDGTNAAGAVRYRVSDSNLPVEESSLPVSAGYAVAVTVKNGMDFVLWGLVQSSGGATADFSGTIESVVDVKLNSLQNGRIAVKLTNGSDYQRITVYHAANGDCCIGQTFERVPDTENNTDVWHLKHAYICDSKTLEKMNANPTADNYNAGQIVNNGEWENAIKESGQDDFMGGTLHGNELLERVAFFLDGKPLDMAEDFLLFGKELKVIEITGLYRVSDQATKVVDRSCVWTFTDGEISVNQTHRFVVDSTLVESYTMMFPVNKLYSETFLVDGNPTLLSFPKENLNSYEPDFTENVYRQLATMYANGVVCEAEVNCNRQGTWGMWDNGNTYNKIYFNIGNREYSAGDTIVTKSVYRMRVGV